MENHRIFHGETTIFHMENHHFFVFRWVHPLAKHPLVHPSGPKSLLDGTTLPGVFLKHVSSKLKIMEFQCEAVEAPTEIGKSLS